MVCLVPELCSMTGLTEAARSDFKVMKVIVKAFGLHRKLHCHVVITFDINF